jgi:hypothetical protein
MMFHHLFTWSRRQLEKKKSSLVDTHTSTLWIEPTTTMPSILLCKQDLQHDQPPE